MKNLLFLLFPFVLFSQEAPLKQQLLIAIDSTNNVPKKVQLYADLAWEYIITENDSALLIADKALLFSKKNTYTLGEAIALETKGLHYEVNKGDYQKASEYYFEGIKICEDNELSYASSIYHSLGALFHTSDNFTKAKEYYKIAYNRAKKDDNMLLLKKAIINLGSVNSSLKEYKDAELFLLEALAIPLRKELDYSINANLGNLYIRQKEYKKALPFLEKATQQHPDNYYSENNLSYLIDAKAALKDSTDMQIVLRRAIQSLKTTDAERKKSIMLMSLSNYYRAFGSYKKALAYRDTYLELYEEIKEKQRDETVYNLETNYQTEKKERKIIEQQLTIERKNRLNSQILFGISTLVLFLIGLYIFFKKRLKYHRTIAIQDRKLQKQQLEELKQKNKLTNLSILIEGQEAERLRIAKDLHDSLGGLLSTVKSHFSSMQKDNKTLENDMLANKTEGLIGEACVEVRRISHNMMPHALSLSGLKGGIEDLGEQLNEQGYTTTFEIDDLPSTLSETKKVMIYRLVQEILSNIKKHAQAKTILIQLLNHKQELSLLVEDDGKGFNYIQAISKGGLGLKSINSRLEFLDATIDWDTKPNEGTSININIPL